MFGVLVKEMVGRDLSEFIPRGCPSNNAEDLLIVGGASTKRGGLGAKKSTVGKLMPLVSWLCAHSKPKGCIDMQLLPVCMAVSPSLDSVY